MNVIPFRDTRLPELFCPIDALEYKICRPR
jgi:hypothetical protein